MTNLPTAHRTLDAQGLYCPEPVMLLHVEMDELAEGQTLKVLATDPTTLRDIPQFCIFLGHELIYQQTETSPYEFYILKSSE